MKPTMRALILSLLCVLYPSDAVITKVKPSDAVIDRSTVKFFVSLFQKGDCAGTVIGGKYVVTAAHCVCGAKKINVIDYKNDKYEAVKAYQNPNRAFNCNRDGPNSNDVAVLEFENGVFANHDPRPVYSKSDEVSKTIWILGMGINGQPDDFPSGNKCRNGKTDGLLREGFNIVDRALNGVIYYDMSPNNSGSQLDKEATAQDGDSGGPALILSNGEWMVAGANSGTDENNSCDWGSVDQYCRLSEHSEWIDQATNDNLNDSTRGLWVTFREVPDDSDDDSDDSDDSDGNCKDDASFRYKGSSKKDCDWIGEKSGRIKKLCPRKSQGKKISESCPVTCGECSDNDNPGDDCEDDASFFLEKQQVQNLRMDWKESTKN